MTYPLLLATVLTSDLRRNAELPKFLVSKLKTTSNPVTDVSLVVSNLSYFEPSLKCKLPKITIDCHRLPNLEQFKRICTLSLICATLQSKFPNHGKSCLLIFSSLSLFFFFTEKNADVENQKSTVLTDAPVEVQPCEG